MGCSFRPDWVAGFLRIRWQLCTGLGGRNHRNTQTRVKTLDGELGAIFKRWYPDMDIEVDEMPAAA
jgi:hypothetical protein